MGLEAFLEDAIRRAIREELRSLLSEFPSTSGPDRRVTAAEGASAAGLSSPATIRAWASAKKISRYGEGKAIRYSLAEILAVRPAPRTLEESAEATAEAILRRKSGG